MSTLGTKKDKIMNADTIWTIGVTVGFLLLWLVVLPRFGFRT